MWLSGGIFVIYNAWVAELVYDARREACAICVNWGIAARMGWDGSCSLVEEKADV